MNQHTTTSTEGPAVSEFDKAADFVVRISERFSKQEVHIILTTIAAVGVCLALSDDVLEVVEKLESLSDKIEKAHGL